MPTPEKHYHEFDLAESISQLACAIESASETQKAQLSWFQSQGGDFNEKQLKRLAELRASIESSVKRAKDEIMSAVTAQLEAANARLNEISASVDAIVASSAANAASQAGINADVQRLKQMVTDLQNSSGGVTEQDQLLINGIQTLTDSLSARTASASAAAAAAAAAAAELDAQTEPVVVEPPPVEPPVEPQARRR